MRLKFSHLRKAGRCDFVTFGTARRISQSEKSVIFPPFAMHRVDLPHVDASTRRTSSLSTRRTYLHATGSLDTRGLSRHEGPLSTQRPLKEVVIPAQAGIQFFCGLPNELDYAPCCGGHFGASFTVRSGIFACAVQPALAGSKKACSESPSAPRPSSRRCRYRRSAARQVPRRWPCVRALRRKSSRCGLRALRTRVRHAPA